MTHCFALNRLIGAEFSIFTISSSHHVTILRFTVLCQTSAKSSDRLCTKKNCTVPLSQELSNTPTRSPTRRMHERAYTSQRDKRKPITRDWILHSPQVRTWDSSGAIQRPPVPCHSRASQELQLLYTTIVSRDEETIEHFDHTHNAREGARITERQRKRFAQKWMSLFLRGLSLP